MTLQQRDVYIKGELDDVAIDGLDATPESVGYRLDEIETHFHSRERWVGKSADQSGDDWAADNLTAFQCISGNGDYGGDANDEAKVLGADDTPIISGMVYFDLHRVLVSDASSITPYKIRIVYGTGTMAAAITAGQYTEVMMTPVASVRRSPIDVPLPRQLAGTKVWMQCKNATNNATLDFFVGVHEYEG